VKRSIFIFVCFFLISIALSQTPTTDSGHLDYHKIYSFCLDANVKPALVSLSDLDSRKLPVKDQQFKSAFESRFKFAKDQKDYRSEINHSLSNILDMFRNYWRASLLDSSINLDSLLQYQLSDLLEKKYVSVKELPGNSDTVDYYLKKMITSSGCYTTGFGKTGRLFDLLIWKKQQDTQYVFSIGNEMISTKVIFMDDFLTLGWEQYATLDRYYPGGWATDTALFCVKQAYDLHSEDFLISYLAHESRHFPKLTPADLEYRAKLTELSLADSSLYSLVSFFISNANYESENAHSLADYCVIRDLSVLLFHKNFENDIKAWQEKGVHTINTGARQILADNTKALLALGAGAGNSIYIKHK